MNWIQKLVEARCPGRLDVIPDTSYHGHPHKDCGCHGTGALAPDLRKECRGVGNYRRAPCNNPVCPECHGQGWSLIPQLEQMGALVDHCGVKDWDIFLWTNQGEMGRSARLTTYPATSSHFGKGTDYKEALCHAICQAHGIE